MDMPHTPRYYFGHGLSYTTFAYSDLMISEKEIDAQGSVRIEAAVYAFRFHILGVMPVCIYEVSCNLLLAFWD